MGNYHVATLSADKYDDVEAVMDRLRGALEKRFGVPTMVEAHYPRWSVSAELSSRDPAPATVAAWAKDWLFDLDPSASVRRGLATPRSRSKKLAVNRSNRDLEAEIKQAMAKPVPKSRRTDPRDRPAMRQAPYRLKLTPDELGAVEYARGRYGWADMLSTHMAEDGSVAFTESEMQQWIDDVDEDGEVPFPLASPALFGKLERFYGSRV